MSTGAQLIARATRKIDEPAFTQADVLDYLNQAFTLATELLMFPGLQATDEVTTSTSENSVALPANYQKGLYRATDADKNQLVIKSNLAALLDVAGSNYTEEGDVSVVCEHGASLVYDMIPADAVDITIFYYRKPAAITALTTALDGVTPSLLARVEDAIIYFAAQKAFEDMESGVDSRQSDAIYNLERGMAIIEEIKRTTSVGVSHPASPVVTGCFR